MHSLIDYIEVDDTRIRIKGSKDLLEKAVLANQATTDGCSQVSTNWRAGWNKTANPYIIDISIDFLAVS